MAPVHRGPDLQQERDVSTRYSVRQRDSGRWQARWYDPSGVRRTKMFDTRTGAKAFLDRTSADKQRKDYIDDRDADRLFADLAEEWLATLVKRAKTLAGYESLLRVHILPFFGSRPVGTI